MSDKFRQIENILFAVFLAEYPIIFYLVKYPSFSDYDIQRAAFYFLLILTALFAILFAFFCCYDFLFTHPLFVKHTFMLFSLIFLPVFTKYVADNLYYNLYWTTFIFSFAMLYTVCTVAPKLTNSNKGYVQKQDDVLFVSYLAIFSISYYLFRLPLYANTDTYTPFICYCGAIYCSFLFIYCAILTWHLLCSHFVLIKRIYMFFCLIYIPISSIYIEKSGRYYKYACIYFIIMFIFCMSVQKLNKRFPQNEYGIPVKPAESHISSKDI